jgi:hypothetical protein
MKYGWQLASVLSLEIRTLSLIEDWVPTNSEVIPSQKSACG